MQFYTALKAAAGGFPIQRSTWNLIDHVGIGEDGFYYRYGLAHGPQLFLPNAEDLAAMDWEIRAPAPKPTIPVRKL